MGIVMGPYDGGSQRDPSLLSFRLTNKNNYSSHAPLLSKARKPGTPQPASAFFRDSRPAPAPKNGFSTPQKFRSCSRPRHASRAPTLAPFPAHVPAHPSLSVRVLCVVSRFALRSVPSRSSSPSPHLRFTGTIILNHQVRYKSSVRVVRVVVVLFFASTRTLRSSPCKPSYTHLKQGRVDPRTRPLRHVLHGSGSSASTLRRRSFPVHFTSYHYQR